MWRDTTSEATAAVLAAVIEHAGMGIALVGLDGVPFQANPTFQRITGYSEPELLAMTFDEFTHPDDVAAAVSMFEEMLAGNRDVYRLEKRYVRPDGSWVWAALTVSPVHRRNGDLLFVVKLVEDVTERKRLQEEILHQSRHDHLTGLPNRRLFDDRFEHAVRLAARQEHKVAVVLLDLNGFKAVNDTFGHAAGDEVLRAVAAVLCAASRDSDTVGRIGGDEFAVLCEGLDSAQHAAEVAVRLRNSLSTSVQLSDGRSVAVSASVGLATADDFEGCENLLSRADARMYEDKAPPQQPRERLTSLASGSGPTRCG